VYSPLTQYGAGTTAKDVGIVGIGGLVRPFLPPPARFLLTSLFSNRVTCAFLSNLCPAHLTYSASLQFGLLFAKALGANVTAISHSESKRADAEKMGATRFIATHGGGDDVFAPHKRSLDLMQVLRVATSSTADTHFFSVETVWPRPTMHRCLSSATSPSSALAGTSSVRLHLSSPLRSSPPNFARSPSQLSALPKSPSLRSPSFPSS
jgi:hypothetical protein